MFGIKEVFGKNNINKADETPRFVSDSLKNKESEIVFFNQSIDKGQTWETEDGQWEITITNHNKGSDRYEIVLIDKKTGKKDSLLEGSEEVKARLLDKDYQLCAQEVEVPENEEFVQEYVTLDQEMAALLEEKIDPLATLVAENIEKHKDVLGEKCKDFSSVRSVILESIYALVAEENILADSLEKEGGITEDLLTKRKAHYENLSALSTALETLNVSVNQKIAENEKVPEIKGVDGEVVIPEPSSNVTNIDEYRNRSKEQSESNESELSPSAAKEIPGQEKEEGVEKKSTNAEQKIGKEKYDALIAMVDDTWHDLEKVLRSAKIPPKILDKVWTTEVLPDLKGKMKVFLRKRTEFGSEERESICQSIMQAISEKK